MVISDPTPNSFTLKQTQVIGTNSVYSPTIYAFDAAVSLLNGMVPFAFVRVPNIKSDEGAKVVISQMVNLNNPDAFGDYAMSAMMNEKASMNIYGKPRLKQGALPKVTVTYNKTVIMKGKVRTCGLHSLSEL